MGLRQAPAAAYDPGRRGGSHRLPGEASSSCPDLTPAPAEVGEIEEEREIHTDEAIEDAILEEKALEALSRRRRRLFRRERV